MSATTPTPAPRLWIRVTFNPAHTGHVMDVPFTDGVGRVEARDQAAAESKLRRLAGLRNIGFIAEIVTEEGAADDR